MQQTHPSSTCQPGMGGSSAALRSPPMGGGGGGGGWAAAGGRLLVRNLSVCPFTYADVEPPPSVGSPSKFKGQNRCAKKK